jgi:prepilin-type N-terminal cleavage/methylation domain-containing protein
VRNKKGFTLIELMIVVAIIGILAAIAIPNFMKFLAKTKRSEVKYNLAAIYTCELSWFGENNAFSNSFNEIRWEPEGKIYYYTFTMGDEYYGLPLAQNPDPGGLPYGATAMSFTVSSWGNIDDDSTLDIWYTNDQKSMTLTNDDLNM